MWVAWKSPGNGMMLVYRYAVYRVRSEYRESEMAFRWYYTYHVLDSKVSSLAYVILGHVLMSLGGYAGDAEGMYA